MHLAVVAFLVCAAVLASAVVCAVLPFRSAKPSLPLTGFARPMVVSGAPCRPTAAAAPAPGRVDGFAVDGRRVLAYLPAAALAGERLPVVYFLHGSPGAAPDWIAGGQLPDLLDLVTRAQHPPGLVRHRRHQRRHAVVDRDIEDGLIAVRRSSSQ